MEEEPKVSIEPAPPWVALAILKYGYSSRGRGVDTAVMARRLRVSQRTIQRWIHEGIPRKRELNLWRGWRPKRDLLSMEGAKLRNALEARDALRVGRQRGILPSWRAQGFLEEHVVWIRQMGPKRGRIPVLRIQSSRHDAEAGLRVLEWLKVYASQADALGTGAGLPPDFIEKTGIRSLIRVPTAFDGEIVKYRALHSVGDYRIRGRKIGILGSRHSLMWLEGGADLRLADFLNPVG